MNILSLALLLWTSSFAQEGAILGDRFLGLNDTDSPAVINEGESQSCLNVESNLEGTALLKRKGFTREAALTVATAPITGSHIFTNDSGNNIIIVCHDRYCAQSTNGAAFSNFLSTAGGSGAVPTRWSWVAVDGDAYGANDRRDPLLRYDGSTSSYPIISPAGSLLELTEDRLAVTDTSANPGRINYSQSGAFTTFTAGIDSESPWTDDLGSPGDRVTGLKYDKGLLYVFKRASITTCLMGDQYTTRCSILDNVIGTQNPNSITSSPDGLYFQAQDNTYWRISGNGLEQISKKISTITRNLNTGSQRSNTQSSQSDWEAGTETPLGSFDTTSISGSIFPSSSTFLDTSQADFSSGTTSVNVSTDTSGEVRLSSHTFKDNFNDGNITSGPAWTLNSGGNFVVTSGILVADGIAEMKSASEVSSGSFKFKISHAGLDGTQTFIKFISTATNLTSSGYAILTTATASNVEVSIVEYPNRVTLCANTAPSPAISPSIQNQYQLTRSATGYMVLYVAENVVCSATDASINHSSQVVLFSNNGVQFDDFDFFGYRDAGYFISRTFDTLFSTPVGGPLTVSSNVPGGITTMSFQVRSASSTTGEWGEFANITNTISRSTETRRYQQFLSSFTTTVSSVSPSMQDWTSVAVTTGQFTSQCINTASNITSWGILSCSQETVGASSITYFTRSSNACATQSTQTWVRQTNNATLTGNTSAALNIRIDTYMASSTETAQGDACTTYWNEGSPSQPVWGQYDPIKNAIYWTATTTGASAGNRVLKYDINLGQWYPFDIPATALNFYNNSLYFGSSGGGFWNKYGASGVDSDNGSDIRAFWRSKDYGGASPFQETSYKKISIVAKNQVTGNMTASYRLSNNQNTDYTVGLGTTTGVQYARHNHNMAITSPQNFINLTFSNISQDPFEVLGFKIDFFTQPWRVLGP